MVAPTVPQYGIQRLLTLERMRQKRLHRSIHTVSCRSVELGKNSCASVKHSLAQPTTIIQDKGSGAYAYIQASRVAYVRRYVCT